MESVFHNSAIGYIRLYSVPNNDEHVLRISEINNSARTMLGMPDGDPVDQEFYPLCFPDSQPDRVFVQKIQNAIEQSGNLVHQMHIVHTDRYADFHIHGKENDELEILMSDSSSLIHIGEELRARENQLKNIILSTGAGTWKWEFATGRVEIDGSLAGLLGYKGSGDAVPDSVRGWVERIYPADFQPRSRSIQAHLSGANDYFESEIRIRRADDSWIWVHERGIIISRSTTGSPEWIFGVIQDITEKKESLLELLQSKEAAEAANAAKSRFIANMSHEIRTPLNGVIGFTDLLKLTHLDELQTEYVENASRSSLALLSIVNEILDFSKIEAGKMDVNTEPTEIIPIMEECIGIISHSMNSRNIELILAIDPRVPRKYAIDGPRMKQIILNLLSNAIKFTEAGEVELGLRLTRRRSGVVRSGAAKHQSEVELYVRDTGIGIEGSQHARLFEAFSQADESTTRKYGGTGLGLVISNSLAEKMGSRIQFTSTPGEGSHFYLLLEGLDAPVTSEPSVVSRLPGQASAESYRIVSLIQNRRNREVLGDWIQFFGSENIAVEDIDALLKHIREGMADVLLLDHEVLGDSLDEVVQAIHRAPNDGGRAALVLLYNAADPDAGRKVNSLVDVTYTSRKPVRFSEVENLLSGSGVHSHSDKSEENDGFPGGAQMSGDKSVGESGRVPARRPAESRRTDGDSYAAPAKPNRILIAEDIELNRRLVESIILRRYPSIDISFAEDGRQALEAVAEIQPGMVFLDIHMPHMDGLSVAREIRKAEAGKNYRIPIVALTAGATSDDQTRCIEAGMDDFITKPVNAERLIELVEHFLLGERVLSGSTGEASDPLDGLIFDQRSLRQTLGGDRAVELELMESSMEDIPKRIEALRVLAGELELAKGQADNDAIEELCQRCISLAHSIKGQAATMRFNRLKLLLVDFEIQTGAGRLKGSRLQALLAEQPGYVSELVQDIDNEWSDIQTLLESRISSET